MSEGWPTVPEQVHCLQQSRNLHAWVGAAALCTHGTKCLNMVADSFNANCTALAWRTTTTRPVGE